MIEQSGLHPIAAQLLRARGITDAEQIRAFLQPDLARLSPPESLHGVGKIAQRLRSAIAAGKRIEVFGDYDCDGIGAAAILFSSIMEAGGNALYFLPDREEDGYGLSMHAIRRVLERDHPDVIVTVDCGITSVKEVEFLTQNGVEVLVSDHHIPQQVLPACPVADPWLTPGATPLCGAGVAFFIARALIGAKADALLDIVALSTVADMVPLTGDNRILAAVGLNRMGEQGVRPGLKALMKVSEMPIGMPISSYDAAFRLAPRLNASGRISNATKSFRLLVTDDPAEAALIADELNVENKRRQELCKQVVEQARAMLRGYGVSGHRVVVLAHAGWEAGVIGIAASKIAEEFCRPTILLTQKEGIYKGSGRSIAGVDLFQLLGQCAPHLLQFGGHAMAAGLSLRMENLDAFIAAAEEGLRDADPALFAPAPRFDLQVGMQQMDIEAVRAILALEPFGYGNPRPVFLDTVADLPVMKIGEHPHLKCRFGQTEMVYFHGENDLAFLRAPSTKAVYYTVDLSSFRNRVTASCVVQSVHPVTIQPDRDSAFVSYLQAFLADGGGKREKCACDMLPGMGHLIVTFDYATFLRAAHAHPTYRQAWGHARTLSPCDTLLLAPDGSMDYRYFREILLCDTPPKRYVAYVDALSSGQVRVANNPSEHHAHSITLAQLRALYVGMRSVHGQVLTPEGGFLAMRKLGWEGSKEAYWIGVAALGELKLLSFEGSVRVRGGSVDLAGSELCRRYCVQEGKEA